MFSWKKDGAQRVPRTDMDLLLPAGHICMNQPVCSPDERLLPGNLKTPGDWGRRAVWREGEVKMKRRGVEVRGLHSAEVKQLLLWEYPAVLSGGAVAPGNRGAADVHHRTSPQPVRLRHPAVTRKDWDDFCVRSRAHGASTCI